MLSREEEREGERDISECLYAGQRVKFTYGSFVRPSVVFLKSVFDKFNLLKITITSDVLPIVCRLIPPVL